MRARLLLILSALLLATAAPAAAQDCNPGERCLGVPWRLPQYPDLLTATPVATLAGTPTAAVTLAGTPTNAAGLFGTPTPVANIAGLSSSMATLQAVAAGTPQTISTALVPTMSAAMSGANLAASASTFFGYAAGMASFNIGRLTPILHFLLFSFVFVLSIQLLLLLAPLISAIFGLVRRMVQLVLDFLPG